MNRFDKVRLSLANLFFPTASFQKIPPLINPKNPMQHTENSGTSGTEIFGGYISEEYLKNLQGRQWAAQIDMMKRSDSNIAMVLRALKLPIKSSNWYIETVGVDADDAEGLARAEKQKKLIEKALFEDCSKSFTRLLGEILTMYENGYSIFEITYRVKFNDKEIGTYNTLKSIAFRSQKTIEKWNVAHDGTLLSVTQNAYGDLGKSVDIDSDFLMHFAPDQEGDNFEGISVLRPMYGNWLRKNAYLKWIAAGTEKSAIPTPTVQIPAGKTGDINEVSAAEVMISKYTSNSANYLMFPEGWVIGQFKLDFDPEKMLKLVQFEDQSMVNSVLASFLLLGQNGGGSLALGQDLSSFFGQTFQCTTDYISEVMGKRTIKPLIQMNFGDEQVMVALKCESLKDDADATFATTLKTFLDSGVVKADSPLEKFIREKYQYPEADPTTARETPKPAVVPELNAPARFAEDKRLTPPDLIRQSAMDLREIFANQISAIGTDYIQALIRNKTQTPSATQSKVPNTTDMTAYKFYKDIISFVNIQTALRSTAQVVNEGVQLSEGNKIRLSMASHNKKVARLEEILKDLMKLSSRYESSADYMTTKSELNKLRREFTAVYIEYKNDIPQWKSAKFKADIEARASTLVETQMGDLKKKIDLQYQSSLRSTDSAKTFEYDLSEAKNNLASGSNIASGADILASQTVNETRLQISLEDPEVESYTFIAVDDDRTTPICSDLNGRTFAPNDPLLARYSPPLHYNCRSYLQINMRTFKDNPAITTEDFAPSEAALKSITLSEKKHVACSHKVEEN